ncbi:energy-coupling factor transport system ATP-binding protein [Breznakia sp. PF5-3]|uniref:energy-coupling factor transporter ATPase n=1 Tax=unclassified Breznakia TaxID=2623764 RepID=UPI002406D90E|nr:MULTISPECIES: energy-coupling factor transporter ATPase [unclassified Breznakia]MDL2276308.1 energy-coupling factor transporter ATPase [Breznakia sp. OttesenSCG-928-G09]MDF9825137.1 energy-coupling factor transport system ATP-binding protein [Breznakia sp. PM6-1]MDF9836004.1 energy-coupling factor transport system ATP-binding protein [Breznakia sp. PF5-3]MDF9838102.1 energy-coupling factor transport system ATP-binding protein [Breznakia sp. PFB2-8]MDF9860068.1 energy-coupling factor transpo
MSIEFKALTHTYNEKTPFPYVALHDVDLEIKEGIFTAIIGETGSGKSTLVQHLNALLTPTSGKVIVDDFIITSEKKAKDLKKLRKKVGLVFQFPEYQLFEETIEKDIAFGPKNFGVEEEAAKKKAREMLALVGLDDSYLNRSPFDLSGGQKRRIAIAGILALDPDILVLDEPTAGLDPQGAKEMMQLFTKLNKEFNKTIIMVTHDMEHVLHYCEDVVVLKKGKVVHTCSANEFFNNYDLLEQLHVALPKVIEFKKMLQDKGIKINPEIFDMHELALELKEELKHG